jgi:hypothetical protein
MATRVIIDTDPGIDDAQPNAKTIATYSHDRVVLGIAPAASREEDKRLLREVARKVVTDAVRNGSVTA